MLLAQNASVVGDAQTPNCVRGKLRRNARSEGSRRKPRIWISTDRSSTANARCVWRDKRRLSDKGVKKTLHCESERRSSSGVGVKRTLRCEKSKWRLSG